MEEDLAEDTVRQSDRDGETSVEGGGVKSPDLPRCSGDGCEWQRRQRRRRLWRRWASPAPRSRQRGHRATRNLSRVQERRALLEKLPGGQRG